MHPSAHSITSTHHQALTVTNLENHGCVQYGTHTNTYVSNKGPGSNINSRVILKSLRILPGSDPRIALWIATVHTLQAQLLSANISHDHLEPFRIVHVNDCGRPLPAIATSWYENGDIMHYVQHNPGVDKLTLIYQVTCAMSYLHTRGIVHGNLFPGNVLITNQGTARVVDVGFNTLITQHMYGGYLPVPATWMYKSPDELLGHGRTTHTDTYALGSTIYAIYTSNSPYQPTSFCNVRGITDIVTRGHQQVFKHSQPAGMSDPVWKTVWSCWEYDAQRRSSTKEIEMVIQNILCHTS